VFQIKMHNKYTGADFDDDLRAVLRRAGCRVSLSNLSYYWLRFTGYDRHVCCAIKGVCSSHLRLTFRLTDISKYLAVYLIFISGNSYR